MVQAKKFGSDDFVFNGIEESEFSQQSGAGFAMGKERRGGVGGRGSKGHNFREAKVANRKRAEKFARDEQKAEE